MSNNLNDLEFLKEYYNIIINEDYNSTYLKKIIPSKIQKILGDDVILDFIEGNQMLKEFLVLTPYRVLYYKQKLMGHDVEDYPISKISSINYKKHMFQRYIKIFTSGNDIEIKVSMFMSGENFVHNAKKVLSKPLPSILNNSEPINISVADELKKLSNLKEEGILTEEEFKEQKDRLLKK